MARSGIRPVLGEYLQQLLHEQFDAAGYEDYIYTGQPRPPLHPDDASWAGQYVDVPSV